MSTGSTEINTPKNNTPGVDSPASDLLESPAGQTGIMYLYIN